MATVKARLGRILHVELNLPGNIVTPQQRCNQQCPIDAGRHTPGADYSAVHHDPLIKSLCAKVAQQVKRSPMRRGTSTAKHTRRSADQSTRADRKQIPARLHMRPDVGKHLFVFHQFLLPRPTRNHQQIKRRRFGDARLRSQDQPHNIPDWLRFFSHYMKLSAR